MEPNQDENTRNVFPEDPLEGMGDLSAIDPVDAHPAEQPVAEGPSFEAVPAIESEAAPGNDDFLQILMDEESETIRTALPVEDPSSRDLSLDQLIETIDEEVESGLEPLRDVRFEPQTPIEAQEAQYIGFSIAGTEYAVPIENVIEIAYVPEITPLPNVPPWILGVANLRGDLLSIVDMRAFFGLEPTALTGSTRMLVGRTTNEDMMVGLLVDRAQGLRSLRPSEIEKPTGDIESQIAPYLSGAYDSDEQMLVLLDLDRVLNSPRLRQFEPQVV